MKTNALAKISAALGLPQAAKAATTAADHRGVLEMAQSRLDAAMREHDALIAKRDTIILDGADVDDYHAALNRAEQNIKTLQGAVDEAGRRYRVATDAEREAKSRSDIAAATEIAVAGFQKGQRDMHETLTAFLQAADLTKANREAIESINWDARAAGVPDLAIDAVALRQTVEDELRPAVTTKQPEQMPTESDAAYNLRVASTQARADFAHERDRPFKIIEKEAIHAIEHVFNPRNPLEVTERRVAVQNFPDRGVGMPAARKFQAVDGFRAQPSRLSPGPAPELPSSYEGSAA